MSEYDESDELNLVVNFTGLFSTKQYFSLAQRQMITTWARRGLCNDDISSGGAPDAGSADHVWTFINSNIGLLQDPLIDNIGHTVTVDDHNGVPHGLLLLRVGLFGWTLSETHQCNARHNKGFFFACLLIVTPMSLQPMHFETTDIIGNHHVILLRTRQSVPVIGIRRSDFSTRIRTRLGLFACLFHLLPHYLSHTWSVSEHTTSRSSSLLRSRWARGGYYTSTPGRLSPPSASIPFSVAEIDSEWVSAVHCTNTPVRFSVPSSASPFDRQTCVSKIKK